MSNKMPLREAIQSMCATPRKPQVGDIAIKNAGALIYVGIVERVWELDGECHAVCAAMSCGADDNKFYSVDTNSYFDVKDSVFVERPQAAGIVAEMEAAGSGRVSTSGDVPCPHCNATGHLGVLGSRPDEVPF